MKLATEGFLNKLFSSCRFQTSLQEFLQAISFCLSRGHGFQFHLSSSYPPIHRWAGESGNIVRRSIIPRRPGVIGRTVNRKNKEVYHYISYTLKTIKGLKTSSTSHCKACSKSTKQSLDSWMESTSHVLGTVSEAQRWIRSSSHGATWSTSRRKARV